MRASYASEVILPRESLRECLVHMEWADARVWNAVPDAESNDPRLRQLLSHIHGVQHAFLTIWEGGDVNAVFQAGTALTTLEDVRRWGMGYYSKVYAFFDHVSDGRLGEPVQLPWSTELTEYLGRAPAMTTLAETVVQVTSHSTYHRGQVNARLRELGTTPPLVDYIAWLWTGRPPAEWKA